jgi:hypothetical protein
MHNAHAEWRIDLARKLAQRIAQFHGVQAIVVAGSVAHDYADPWSDVEIPIFWDALPDDSTRHAIVHSLNASFLYGYDGPSAEDQLLIDGLQVDLWHITVAHEEATIQAVLEGRQTDLGSLNAMDTARSCIPLYGHEIVDKWKKQAQAYPEALAQQVIRDHISSFRIAELFLLAARDNPSAFYEQLSFLHQELFLVLLALNRSYFPTYKWLYRALEAMRVEPRDIEQRLRRAFAVPYTEAIADTKQVLEETLTLVELQFPGLDTTQARRQLGYTRTQHMRPVSS